MENTILEDIKNYAIKKITQSTDYCGVAEGPEFALLNSTLPNGQDFKITIEVGSTDKVPLKGE